MVEAPFSQPKQIDYREQPTIQDFAYYYVLTPTVRSGRVHEEIMLPAFNQARDKFGIVMRQLSWGELPKRDGKVTYLLIGAMDPLTLTDEEGDYFKKLSSLTQARVNRITLFDDTSENRKSTALIVPDQDSRLGINTIYPDNIADQLEGRRTVTEQSILNNIVCETIRVLYRANKDSSYETFLRLQASQEENRGDILSMQQLMKTYGLYHRSPTDGMVGMKTKEGLLVSQTQTDKTIMTPQNFSLVTALSPEANQVYYAGQKIPSSDVEFMGALDALPYRMAIHFHHNPTVRNEAYASYRSHDVIDYGRFGSTTKVVASLQHRENDSVALLKNHGWVWFGDTMEVFETFVHEELGIAKVG